MKKIFNKKYKKLLLFLFFISICGFLLLFNFKDNRKTDIALADTFDNVYGYAWSSNIGWISFNNCASFDPLSCSGPDYGVYINNTTGQLDGFAWSSNVGWIYFGPDNNNLGTYGSVRANDAPNGGPTKQWPEYDAVSGNITGWAKILSLGDEGWISFSSPSNLDRVNISDTDGDLEGYAWNGDSNGHGIGWISFNDSNYRVFYNNPPSAVDLTAPDQSVSDACDLGVLNDYLKWTFEDIDEDRGDHQMAYQIIFDNGNTITAPYLFDTGYCTGAVHDNCFIAGDAVATRYPIWQAAMIPANNFDLEYNTEYTWQVTIWDTEGFRSTSLPHTFTTLRHERPEAGFDYFPTAPSAAENILFNSVGMAPPPPAAGDVFSKYYSSASPNSTVNCDDAHCDYVWSIISGTGNVITNGESTAIINFTSPTSPANINSVRLRVVDSDTYWCETEDDYGVITVKKKLPKWIETK